MAEPVSLALAKQHLRIDPDATDEDSLIEGIISDARAWVENYTGQSLLAGEKVEYIDAGAERLLAWPITSVDAVAYRGRDGVEVSLEPTSYVALTARRPARVRFYGATCSAILRSAIDVKVTMQAGYADGEVPRGMIRAMLLLITGYYEQRDTGGLSDDVERAARAACGSASRGWRV